MDLFADSPHTALPSWLRPVPATRRLRLLLAGSLLALTFTVAEVGLPLESPTHISSAAAATSTVAATSVSEAEPTWVSPVPAMEIIEAFDPPTEAWLKGHRGIDVLTVSGEPVRAPAAGTIRFRGTVAGTATVSIVTDSGHVVSFQPAKSELKKGERFAAGEEIGTVGKGSHCDESCLHIGVWAAQGDKVYIDPAGFFGQEESILLPLSRKPAKEPTGDSTTSGAGAWGGHRNGRIPAAAMCTLDSAPGQMLRCDAQKAFDRMSHAYEARFSTPISVTDAYRDYDTQVILKKRKGRMAATPGTSNHGWALAVDLGGGINSFGSAQHQWMRANAPKFGWIHPGWARQSGSLPEPWHWEFRQ
ncbi:MAG: peptidoglycan DD-metalloendopeptidase family protein [Brevibacterium aurantiacum]